MPLSPIDLLQHLACGTDYKTGEPFLNDHILNDPQCIRALHWALQQCSPATKQAQPARKLANGGASWTEEEEALLRTGFEKGLPIRNLATSHGRSPIAISSRLKKLGLIAWS